ncbi:hypothetical protein FQN54_000850 [Arachnomyces sp. PD_36]|nr:hypothetical protein FQN54_000850 [Arachnomyces sp. PD_36]
MLQLSRLSVQPSRSSSVLQCPPYNIVREGIYRKFRPQPYRWAESQHQHQYQYQIRFFHSTHHPHHALTTTTTTTTENGTDDDCSTLSRSQLKSLFWGRFPADYSHDDVILLKNLPDREYRQIVRGFDRTWYRSRRGMPTGHLLLEPTTNTITVLRTPPSEILFPLIPKVEHMVQNALEASNPNPPNPKNASADTESIEFDLFVQSRMRIFLPPQPSKITHDNPLVTKVPDFMAQYFPYPYTPCVLPKPVFIAEVGFSSSGSSGRLETELDRYIRQYFASEPSIQFGFLIHFSESPRFNLEDVSGKIPTPILQDTNRRPNIPRLKENKSKGDGNLSSPDIDTDTVFVGDMSAWLQLWTRDPNDVEGRVKRGEKLKFYSSSTAPNTPDSVKLELDIDIDADFGPRTTCKKKKAKEKMRVVMNPDFAKWRSRIKSGRAVLAYSRLEEAIETYKKEFKERERVQ